MLGPHWFDDLPRWAAVLSVSLAILVVMIGVSMLIGVVVAGIAIGAELGSPTIGAIAAIVGIVALVGPIVAVVLAVRKSTPTDDPRFDREPDDLTRLKEQYTAGEIDEATFERRVTALFAEADRQPDAAVTDSTDESLETDR